MPFFFFQSVDVLFFALKFKRPAIVELVMDIESNVKAVFHNVNLVNWLQTLYDKSVSIVKLN